MQLLGDEDVGHAMLWGGITDSVFGALSGFIKVSAIGLDPWIGEVMSANRTIPQLAKIDQAGLPNNTKLTIRLDEANKVISNRTGDLTDDLSQKTL